ncbi:MAG: glycogen/starch/alpha-glucan family phosphorylase [Ferrovum sp.]|jgi:starch phosphorylase|nr:glycogen/starch/alpha-glucan family phosphorylase [Ferrovum sp.]NDU89664.1 glycogen/starch/alpha-glucan phosphorylase [Ferrovum sp.]
MAKRASTPPLPHDRPGLDKVSLQRSISNHLLFTVGKTRDKASPHDWFMAVAHTVRDCMTENWIQTQERFHQHEGKRVYYLSLEFLLGRMLVNSLYNLGLLDTCRESLSDLGVDFESIRAVEEDAGLGNGGLGRLAACFMDSLATLNYSACGYGIRYEYGMFHQDIENGEQIERPDSWLRFGNPWEFRRPEVSYEIHFGGTVTHYREEDGIARYHWVDTEVVLALAYDIPVPGHATPTTNSLRLWSAKGTHEFDLRYFNEGDYMEAVANKNDSENLSMVLYPDDSSMEGRMLRLKQQYFFVSASLQDIVQRHLNHHPDLSGLADKVAIQLNDTHPSLCIPELMRLLLDVHHWDWDSAWSLTTRLFSYTNHTIMPEALETWSVDLMEKLLPRHLQLVYEINHRLLEEVRHRHPGDPSVLQRLSLIDETGGRRIRMAHLSIVGSHHVNGVAQLHTQLLKTTTFAEFDALYPGKILNVTNGITPRRWLNEANFRLSSLLSETLGEAWKNDLSKLSALSHRADDETFQRRFRTVKQANKQALAAYLLQRHGMTLDPDTLFDVQVKRIHEYKRQLLNVLGVITRYNRLRSGQADHMVPRTVIFSGKAAPGYAAAKRIIALIHAVAEVINNDPLVHDRLKVVFIPNYNVTIALRLIPAAELSEQISTAGTEASGTGNMKLALNGALTLGTLDGANIEIGQAVGWDNFFVFGETAEQIAQLQKSGYHPQELVHTHEELRQVLDMIAQGFFSPDQPNRFAPIVEELTTRDRFFLLADYEAYIAAQERVDDVYRNPTEWTRRSILNVAHMGVFSSDRCIQEYARNIWHLND